MIMEAIVKFNPTPKEMAELLWGMGSDEQAEMFKHLFDVAGSEHDLMMQFMATRDDCEERKDESLLAFQAMFSSCYKYMTL